MVDVGPQGGSDQPGEIAHTDSNTRVTCDTPSPLVFFMGTLQVGSPGVAGWADGWMDGWVDGADESARDTY